jgi:protein-S-isoprenylcysteine O-methyltransferase Ste14
VTARAIEPFDQRIRKNALRALALLLVPPLILTRPHFTPEGAAVELMEVFGFVFILVGVLGRLWSILYIGRHKNRSLVTDGPYSMTRNPLYFFSSVGAFGFGLMFGKITLALLLGGTVLAVVWLTARRERAFLAQTFGADYAAYAARVPMLLPDPRLFTTEATVLVSAGALRRNLLDAFVFLAAFPLSELSEYLYVHGGPLPIALP